MQQISIEKKEGNLLSIKAPWNPLFVAELKKLHGKWNPDEKVWIVNDFAQEQLNAAILEQPRPTGRTRLFKRSLPGVLRLRKET